MATAAFGDPRGGGQYTCLIKGTDDIIYNTKSNACITIYSLEWQIKSRARFVDLFIETTEMSLYLFQLCLFSGLISYYPGRNKTA